MKIFRAQSHLFNQKQKNRSSSQSGAAEKQQEESQSLLNNTFTTPRHGPETLLLGNWPGGICWLVRLKIFLFFSLKKTRSWALKKSLTCAGSAPLNLIQDNRLAHLSPSSSNSLSSSGDHDCFRPFLIRTQLHNLKIWAIGVKYISTHFINSIIRHLDNNWTYLFFTCPLKTILGNTNMHIFVNFTELELKFSVLY